MICWPGAIKFLAIIIMIASAPPAFSRLTGDYRANFVNSALQACFNAQRSSSVNKQFSDEDIYNYCKCNAYYMADYYNESFLRGVEKGEQKLNPAVNEWAGKYCASHIKRK